ncbi:MAG: metallophosphoesterase [Clostridiales bacterium]|nr:metallophosphoesterase [Clostridiales bacterium]
MRILAVSDIESKYIWDYFDPAVFAGVDLMISCGDLKAAYLSYLVTMIPAPLFYVHGNHDYSYFADPPEGCVNIDGKVITYRGLRIAGLGGCRGNMPEKLQFSEPHMEKRVRRLEQEIKKGREVDIFVTHAPPLGFGDGKDEFHRGFKSFLVFDEVHCPKIHLFGHHHLPASPVNRQAVFRHECTTMINASGYRLVDIDSL